MLRKRRTCRANAEQTLYAMHLVSCLTRLLRANTACYTRAMQFSNLFVVLYCVGTFLSFLLNNFIERTQYVFRKKYGRDIPPELAPYITLADAEKTCAYKDARYRLWVFEYGASTALGAALLLSGFYPCVFRALKSVSDNPYALTLIFALTVSIPSAVLSLPFEWYEEFVIEKRFGFSSMTLRLWIADKLKSFAVALVVSVLLLSAMTAIFEHVSAWPFVLASVYVAFSLLMSFIYPRLIAPLFNKFTPLGEGALKSRISDFMERTGFKSSGVFIMDASKRSKHSNAYFTGFGKTKRVVLYDTLVEQLSVDEVGAVLAHELGHYKKHHIVKRFAVTIPLVYIVLVAAARLTSYEALYRGFGFSYDAALPYMKFIALFLLSEVFGGYGIFVRLGSNFFSRKDEYEADAYAKKLCGSGKALSSALIALNRENNGEVRTAKIYSAFTYSHPTLLERLRALE